MRSVVKSIGYTKQLKKLKHNKGALLQMKKLLNIEQSHIKRTLKNVKTYSLAIGGKNFSTLINANYKPTSITEYKNPWAFPDNKFIEKDDKNKSHFQISQAAKYYQHHIPTISFNDEIATYSNGYWHTKPSKTGIEDVASIITKSIMNHGGNISNRSASEVAKLMARLGRKNNDPFIDYENDRLINFKNGVLYYKKMVWYDHDKNFMMNYQIPIAFPAELTQSISNLATPETDRLLKNNFGDDAEYVWTALLGYSFIRSNAHWQLINFIYGVPQNGKSTFQNKFLEPLFGITNISSLSEEQLTIKGTFNLANLRGKVINIASDMKNGFNSQWDVLKRVSGNDLIEVEKKGIQAKQMRNTASLLFITNVYPEMPLDAGLNRRINIIEMRTPALVTPELKQKYAVDWKKINNELPQVAFKAILKYRSHSHDEMPPISEHMQQQKEQFKRNANPVSRFVEENFADDEPENGVSVNYAYDHFKGYIKFDDNDSGRIISKNEFKKQLQAMNYNVESRQRHGCDDDGTQLTRIMGTKIVD